MVIEDSFERLWRPTDVEPRDEAAYEAAAKFELGEAHQELPSDVAISIDPENSRDRDDAFKLITLEDGSRLLDVSISGIGLFADQLPKEVIDRALDLGYTRYNVGQAMLPMFPPSLSENLFSILEDKATPVVTLSIAISPEGVITGVEPKIQQIKTVHFNYEEIAGVMSDPTKELEQKILAPYLELARQQHANRLASGDLTAELSQAGDDPNDPFKGREGERIVDACMTYFSEAMTKLMIENGVPGLYRKHRVLPPRGDRPRRLQAGEFTVLPSRLKGWKPFWRVRGTAPLRQADGFINHANFAADLMQQDVPREERIYPFDGQKLVEAAEHLNDLQQERRRRLGYGAIKVAVGAQAAAA